MQKYVYRSAADQLIFKSRKREKEMHNYKISIGIAFRVVPLPVNLIRLTLPVSLPVTTANYQKNM
jgi:hypothetical protein